MKSPVDLAKEIAAKFLKSKSVNSNVESGTTVAKSGGYAAGDKFIRNGVLCKALGTLTQGDPWTNYTEGTDYEADDPLCSQIEALANKVGDLTDLETTVKTDTVSAINECVVEIKESGIVKVTTPSFSSLPQTFTAIGIDGDHELAVDGFALVSPSSAMGNDWNITTAVDSGTGNGQITISGTFVGSTACTVKMSLTKPVKAITAS